MALWLDLPCLADGLLLDLITVAGVLWLYLPAVADGLLYFADCGRESDRCVPLGVFNQSYYITIIFQEIATILLDLLIFLCMLLVSTEIEDKIVSAMFRETSVAVP